MPVNEMPKLIQECTTVTSYKFINSSEARCISGLLSIKGQGDPTAHLLGCCAGNLQIKVRILCLWDVS